MFEYEDLEASTVHPDGEVEEDEVTQAEQGTETLLSAETERHNEQRIGEERHGNGVVNRVLMRRRNIG